MYCASLTTSCLGRASIFESQAPPPLVSIRPFTPYVGRMKHSLAHCTILACGVMQRDSMPSMQTIFQHRKKTYTHHNHDRSPKYTNFDRHERCRLVSGEHQTSRSGWRGGQAPHTLAYERQMRGGQSGSQTVHAGTFHAHKASTLPLKAVWCRLFTNHDTKTGSNSRKIGKKEEGREMT